MGRMNKTDSKELMDVACRIARIEERQISIAAKLDDDIGTTRKLLHELSVKVSSLEKLKTQLVVIATLFSVALSMLWDWLYYKITGQTRH